MFKTEASGDSKFRIPSLALVFYLAGFLVVLAETIFHIYGKSLCTTEGCRIVESFVKGGDLVLLLAGLLLFGILIFISFYKFPQKIKTLIEYIHSGILIAALSVEGYLLGFQLFIIKELCIFCLTVFGILFISSVARLFKKRLEMAYAFAGFVCVFLITYFVNPGINPIPSSGHVIVYSKGCPHCEEVIQFCKTHYPSVQTIEAKEVAGTLRALKIDHVPVLFCDEGTTKKFIVGGNSIKEYLLSKAPETNTQEEVCPIFENGKCQ
ncbi:MAG: hypothetical protein ACP5JA_04260 [Thermodesulfovibrio sp.]